MTFQSFYRSITMQRHVVRVENPVTQFVRTSESHHLGAEASCNSNLALRAIEESGGFVPVFAEIKPQFFKILKINTKNLCCDRRIKCVEGMRFPVWP